jgi:hypothetical protein
MSLLLAVILAVMQPQAPSAADLQQALQTQPLVYAVRPADRMPSATRYAYYDPPNPYTTEGTIVVNAQYAGMLADYGQMPVEAQRQLLYAAAFDVMDSRAAGPAWKMFYMNNVYLDVDCDSDCFNPFTERIANSKYAVEPLLGQHITLHLSPKA